MGMRGRARWLSLLIAVGCLVGMVAAMLHAPSAVTLVLAMGSAVGLLAFLRPGLVRELRRLAPALSRPAAPA